MLTVQGEPDLRVVVPVGDLPDIKGLGGRVGQQAEEEDDGVGWGKTFWMDLPGKRQEHSAHSCESQLVYRTARRRLRTRVAPVLKLFPPLWLSSSHMFTAIPHVGTVSTGGCAHYHRMCIITQLEASLWAVLASNPLLSNRLL